jgi:hypothetical protein
MQCSRFAVSIILLASLACAQQDAPPAPAPPVEKTAPAPAEAPARPTGTPVDSAKINGSTFESVFFKFTYQLPKDWKALDDSVRLASNQKLHEEDSARPPSPIPVRPKSSAIRKTARGNAHPIYAPTDVSVERYSLLVASPTGVDSLESPVMPRINVWAHRRVASLDDIGDHAQFLLSAKRVTTLVEPQKVSLDGHDFVRVDIRTPSGRYRSQFVTMLGDYLVGLEFWAASQKELNNLVDTTKTIKFQ